MPNGKRPLTGTEVRHLRYGYYSPRWLYVLGDLTEIAVRVVFAAFMGAWLLLVLAVNPLSLTTGQSVVASIAGITVAGIGTRLSIGFLAGFRGGYGLKPHGSNRLVGEFTPGRIRLRVKGRWIDFSADTPHSFLMREHSERLDEARAEERARAHGYGQQPDHVRRAFDIILDRGVTRTVLAEVAFEDQARDMVRRLHELDSYARGGAEAGTATRPPDQPGRAPVGKRPMLD
jgi:hypothetical protein